MTANDGSRIGVDGLGANFVDSVDVKRSNEMPIVEDLVFGGASRSSLGAGDRLPGQVDGVSDLGSFASDDRSRDNPLENDVVGAGASRDGETAGVLRSEGINAVDDVGAHDSGALLELGGGEARGKGNAHEEDSGQAVHGAESKKGIGPIFKGALTLGVLIVIAVMAFAILEPVQVLPRIRLAPGFALTDQSGGVVTSEDGKGAVTLYAFAPVGCGAECDSINSTMADVRELVTTSVDLGSADFRMVTVALNSDSPEELAAAAVAGGADGEVWRWAGADDEVLDDVVGGGFRVFFDSSDPDDVSFDPTFVIVDGAGLIRGEYPYATISSDADRLSRHIEILGEEILYAKGNNALIYEAAHIFLCYP